MWDVLFSALQIFRAEGLCPRILKMKTAVEARGPMRQTEHVVVHNICSPRLADNVREVVETALTGGSLD